jgi:hypothetical protein
MYTEHPEEFAKERDNDSKIDESSIFIRNISRENSYYDTVSVEVI